jgi:hypothetical protein
MSFLKLLSDLYSAYQLFQIAMREIETERKDKADAEKIQKAFRDKDAGSINAIFNDGVPNSKTDKI